MIVGRIPAISINISRARNKRGRRPIKSPGGFVSSEETEMVQDVQDRQKALSAAFAHPRKSLVPWSRRLF
jgi:hypothetical protein